MSRISAEPVVTVRVMVGGYRDALARFQEAAETWDHDITFQPLFEALSWATAIDERCRRIWVPDGKDDRPGYEWQKRLNGHETLKGVRFVRNRVHHQWAEAFESRDVRSARKNRPIRYVAWVWKRVEDLPEAPAKHRDVRIRPFYVRLLAGKPVEATLIGLATTFDQIANLLEPPRPRAAEMPT